MAVMDDSLEMVKLLLSLGADTEITSSTGQTALWYAAGLDVIETLVRAGASVNHLDSFGENLLLKAVRANRADVLRALLSHETNDGVSTAFIDSAFKEAVLQPTFRLMQERPIEKLNRSNRIDIICQLIPKVSDHGLVSDHSIFEKCLHLEDAVSSSHFNMCELLLQHGFAYSRELFYDKERLMQFPEIYNKMSHASFARLLIPTSNDRNLLKSDMENVLRAVPHRLRHTNSVLHETVRFVIRCLSDPLSLQDFCVITARTRLRGRIWSKIDALPLPPLLKDKLKLL